MKKILIIFLAFLFTLALRAQDISLKVEYPSVVNAGEQFTIMWTVNSGGGEFAAPSFNGFTKLMGPQTSYSSSTQLINGKMSHQTSYSYVYYLQASREGKYVISPAEFTFKKSNLCIKFPAFNNFLKSDIATPPLTSLRQENVRGTIYGTGVVQQFLLYPQVTGDIEIDPVQISVLVQQKSKQSDPFFGDFFTSYQTIPRSVASQSMKVHIKPLPGVKPADYSGVVGQLSMKAALNKDTVNVNDPVNFTITVTGNGNLKVAAAPELKLTPDIEVYDPKITDDLKNSITGTSGQKTFEYLLIPRHNGDFIIPPVTYSFFNTSSGRYEKLTTREFRFHAKKGSDQNSGGITVYGGVSKEDVKYLGKDIRFIKSDPGNLAKAANIILSRRSFYSFYAFAALAFIVILFLRREHIRRNSDVSQVKNRKAGKVAVKRLHNAAICLKNDEIDRFYEEILKAVWGYLSDKLSIPVSEMTRSNAVTALSDRGVDEQLLDSLKNILDTCEYARYAPSASETGASDIYEKTSQFIKSVENLLT
ncbi:MAG: protein BatD [Bacteroidales bacterium]|nr:protein BatD [Bacteroidales bacterium]